MATAAVEFDMEESDVLFGMDEEDERCEEEDEDDEPREEVRKKTTQEKGGLLRVESCGKDEFSSRRGSRRWAQQSRSMPAPSSGFMLAEAQAHRWRRNNQLDFNEDGEEDIDEYTESLPLEADSDPIRIPTTTPHMIAIPVQSSAPMHWRRRSTEENDDNEFIPPHQMVERDCFSLGMKHYFKHKPGNI